MFGERMTVHILALDSQCSTLVGFCRFLSTGFDRFNWRPRYINLDEGLLATSKSSKGQCSY